MLRYPIVLLKYFKMSPRVNVFVLLLMKFAQTQKTRKLSNIVSILLSYQNCTQCAISKESESVIFYKILSIQSHSWKILIQLSTNMMLMSNDLKPEFDCGTLLHFVPCIQHFPKYLKLKVYQNKLKYFVLYIH